MKNSIIAIDDETDFLESIKRGLLISGFKHIVIENDPEKAMSLFEKDGIFDIAIIDVTMPKMSGIELLKKVKKISPETECIMVTAIDEAKTAVDAMKMGAYDYLLKPVEKDELVLSINRALERKRLSSILDIGKSGQPPKLKNKDAFKDIVTGSSDVLKVLREAELHAASDVPILITGESGTGKELLARAIHASSPRSKHPFIPVNMAAITPTLFDSEFFGHTKGAFTGADRERAGYLEFAGKGSVFLDEIGTLAIELQGKLLRVLQNGEYIKVGESRPSKTSARFITATNEDLERLVSSKKFRKDLYYRLKGGWLHMPPLRRRKEDIPLLVDRFIYEICGTGTTVTIEETVMSALISYDYPGNIRELKGIIQSAVNLSQGKTISLRHLPENLRGMKTEKSCIDSIDGESVITLDEIERNHILKVYNKTKKNKSRTARLLGIGLNTLRRKLESYK